METKTTLIKVEVEGYNQAIASNAALTKELDKQEISIAKLREENKKLTKERNDVNINSEEGRKRLKELNDQLDSNNKKIKENVDQYTKQKINIGDYKGALDKLVPGLGATADGFTSMATTAKAFIATPIGAVVGALGLALGALIAYFKNTGSGQDALAEKTAVLKVAFEGLMRGVEAVGKVVAGTFNFLLSVAEKLIGFVSPAAEAALKEAAAAGVAIAKLEDEIDDRETALIEKRAKTQLEVSKLRERALSEEGEQRRATIQEAIDLEKGLADEEVGLANMRLELFRKTHAGKKDLTDEEKREQAELTAAVTDAENQKYQATLRFTKEIEKLNDEKHKKEDERRALEQERAAQDELFRELQKIKAEEEKTKAEEELVKAVDSRLAKNEQIAKSEEDLHALIISLGEEEAKKEQETSDKGYLTYKKTEEAKTKIAKLEQLARLQGLSLALGQAMALFEEDTVAHKFLAIARATVDAYTAFNIAMASIPPPFGAIVGATSLALGLANVAKIAGVGFEEGGYTGDGGKSEVAGVVHRGEYVVPQNIVSNPAYAGYISALEGARMRGYQDGGLVTNTATQEANQMAMLSKMFDKIQLSVSWREGERIGNDIRWKEQISQI